MFLVLRNQPMVSMCLEVNAPTALDVWWQAKAGDYNLIAWEPLCMCDTLLTLSKL